MKNFNYILIFILMIFSLNIKAQTHSNGQSIEVGYWGVDDKPTCLKIVKNNTALAYSNGEWAYHSFDGPKLKNFLIPCDWEAGIYKIYYDNNFCQGENYITEFVLGDKNISPSTNLTFCTTDNVDVSLSSNFVDTNGTFEWFYDVNMSSPVPASKFTSTKKNNLLYSASGEITTKYYYRGRNSFGCYSPLYNLTVTIRTGIVNLQITNNNSNICKGNTQMFTAGAQGENIQYRFWQDASRTIPISNTISNNINNNTYTLNTNNINVGSYSFWVDAINSKSTICKSNLLKVDYNVVPQPLNLNIIGSLTYCIGDTVFITPSASNATSYIWAYDSNFLNLVEPSKIDINGNLNFTANNTILNKKYYVKAINGICETNSLELTLNVKKKPGIVSVSNNNISVCQNESLSFIAGATNADGYLFYQDASLTIPISNGINYNTYTVNTNDVISNAVFWIVAINNNECTGESLKVEYEIKAKPLNLYLTGKTSYCMNEKVLITPRATNAKSYIWAYDSNFLNLVESSKIVGNNLEYTATSASTTNYYVKAVNGNGCESSYTDVSINIIASPTNLNVTNNNASVCKGDSIIFEAFANSTDEFEFEYYKDLNLLIPIESSYISGNKGYKLTIPTNSYNAGLHKIYLIAKSSANCSTNPFEITFTVNEIPGATSISGQTIYCLNNNIEFTLKNSKSTHFIWYSDVNGLNLIDNQYLSNNGATIIKPTTTIGLTKLYYRAVNVSGCLSSMQEIQFNVLAAPTNISITNNLINYCVGDDIDVIAGANNATSYEWFLDSNATTLVDNAYVYGTLGERYRPINLTPGDYSVWVRGVNSQECSTKLTQVNFTVKIKPIISKFNTINNNSLFIAGSQILLNINGTNYDRYKILKNNTNFIPNNNNFVTGNITQFVLTQNATLANEGIYTLILSNGTCEQQIDLSIIIIPQQIIISHNRESLIDNDEGVKKVILKRHQDIHFSTSISTLNNYVFEWNFESGFNNTIGNHFYNNPGEYNVSVNITNTTINETFTLNYTTPIKVVLDNDTIEFNPFSPSNDDNYIIYPNPVIDNINIKFNNSGSSYIATCRIFNLEGISLFVENIIVQPGKNLFLFESPIINQPSGAYIMRISKNFNDYQQFTILKQ